MGLILKSKQSRNNKEDVRLVGFQVPIKTASFLSLYCLSEGVTKTVILLNLLNSWCKEQQRNITKEEMIRKIAERAIDTYNNGTKRTNYPTFCRLLHMEFENKGLSKQDITEIFNIIKYEKDKKK